MKKVLNGSVSHTEEAIRELRADRQFAIEYLKAALEELEIARRVFWPCVMWTKLTVAWGPLRRRPVSAGRRFTARCPRRVIRP